MWLLFVRCSGRGVCWPAATPKQQGFRRKSDRAAGRHRCCRHSGALCALQFHCHLQLCSECSMLVCDTHGVHLQSGLAGSGQLTQADKAEPALCSGRCVRTCTGTDWYSRMCCTTTRCVDAVWLHATMRVRHCSRPACMHWHCRHQPCMPSWALGPSCMHAATCSMRTDLDPHFRGKCRSRQRGWARWQWQPVTSQ